MRGMVLALCLLVAGPALAQDQPSATSFATDARTTELDAYIDKAMGDWKMPGLSIAIVKDGQTVYLRGFGVRTVGEPTRVDTHTRFGMMSTTKALTAMAVAT